MPEKLPTAPLTMYAEKRALRAKNLGILPESYSRREREYYSALHDGRRKPKRM